MSSLHRSMRFIKLNCANGSTLYVPRHDIKAVEKNNQGWFVALYSQNALVVITKFCARHLVRTLEAE